MSKPPRGHTSSGRSPSISKYERTGEMKYRFLLLTATLIALSTNAYGHGDDTRKKPEKVSSATMQEKTKDSTHLEAGHEGDTQAARDKVAERDFDTIRAVVKSSKLFVVLKALALAVAIIGLGVVYLPRKTGGSS